jgi:drug/metabolite transporter (DMT)-like permease
MLGTLAAIWGASFTLIEIALVYGVLPLGERLSPAALAGLALVLGGVALGTGAVRLRRAASLPA